MAMEREGYCIKCDGRSSQDIQGQYDRGGVPRQFETALFRV